MAGVGRGTLFERELWGMWAVCGPVDLCELPASCDACVLSGALRLIITPQSPLRARGFSRASMHAGQVQKNAGTPHPAPVPMNVNVWVLGFWLGSVMLLVLKVSQLLTFGLSVFSFIFCSFFA